MIWVDSDSLNFIIITILEFLIGLSSRDWGEPDQTKWVSDSLQTVLHLGKGKKLFMLFKIILYVHTEYTFIINSDGISALLCANQYLVAQMLKASRNSFMVSFENTRLQLFFICAVVPLWSVGLWAPANDIQSLCRIYTQILCQEEEDALFLWCNHSGGKTFLLFIDKRLLMLFWITFDCNYFGNTFTVYGFTYTLHGLGDLYNPACKVHQWCTEKIRRRRGGLWLGLLSCYHVIIQHVQQFQVLTGILEHFGCVQKEVEEEKQARVDQVSDLLCWVKGLQQRSRGPTAESSLAAQQVQLWSC